MFRAILSLLVSYVSLIFLVDFNWGSEGLFGQIWNENFGIKITIYTILISHLTITAMSLSFHRAHTHKGVVFNKFLDTFMQTWLWCVTSMSKLDWVSVHLYHHNTSDTDKDPHSPVVKGFWRVFILGVVDYAAAKSDPEVIKIRNKIKRNRYEQFISENMLLGPTLLTAGLIILFGPIMGTLLSVINFLVSPLFAVGGVNAVAHMWGYINHSSGDNSRNIGFLFPLNFIICGELDHNNHHGHPRSCTFRHRWFEFDIGYFYINILEKIGLAEIKNAYTPKKLKQELSRKIAQIMEKDYKYQQRCEELARELNISYLELKEKIQYFIEGKKVELEAPIKELIRELRATYKMNLKLNFSY